MEGLLTTRQYNLKLKVFYKELCGRQLTKNWKSEVTLSVPQDEVRRFTAWMATS